MIDRLQAIATQISALARDVPPQLLLVALALALVCFALPLAGRQALRRRHARSSPMAPARATPPSRGDWSNRLWQRAADGHAADRSGAADPPGSADPSWRYQAIAANGFRLCPLLNRSQARLLPILEKLTYTRGRGHRLMAQTTLSEVVQPVAGIGTSADRLTRAARALEGQHLDFALFDGSGLLVAAIEVERPRSPGPGSADSDTALRREVLRKAGVPLLSLPPFAAEAEVAALLLPCLAPSSGG